MPNSGASVKPGRPSWRRLLFAGWAMFAVSFFLPVADEPSLLNAPPPPPPPAPVAQDAEPTQPGDPGEAAGRSETAGLADSTESTRPGVIRGWEAALWVLREPDHAIHSLSVLSNILILLTFLKLGGVRPPAARWLTGSITGAAIVNLYWGALPLLDSSHDPESGWVYWDIGYWIWAASFLCVALALLLRDRESALAAAASEARPPT